jgi:hypothetical protein
VWMRCLEKYSNNFCHKLHKFSLNASFCENSCNSWQKKTLQDCCLQGLKITH